MSETDLYLLKVDAVAGEGCRYELGRPMQLLVLCKASSSAVATEAAMTPLALAGWTAPRMVDVGPMAPDHPTLEGVPAAATRHALANGYAIIAYP